MSFNLGLAFGHHHFDDFNTGDAARLSVEGSAQRLSDALGAPSESDQPADSHVAHVCVLCATAVAASLAAMPSILLRATDYRMAGNSPWIDVEPHRLRKAAFQSRAPPDA